MSECIKIAVIGGNSKNTEELFHKRDRTLLHTLREGGIVLPSLCNSLGKCGRCLVKFHGYAPLPSQTDRAMLSPDRLRDGYRLACMARPGKDCTVEICFVKEPKLDVVTADCIGCGQKARTEGESKEQEGIRSCILSNGQEAGKRAVGEEGSSTSALHRKPLCKYPQKLKQELRIQSTRRIAAAVDIGTTTIAMQLTEAGTGHILATYTCLNPQRGYGSDVISRIQAGAGGDGETLQRLVREAVSAGIRQMEKKSEDGTLYLVEYVVIAANTAMGHLFMGYPVETLGKSPFQPVNITTVRTDCLGVPAVLVPGISAFVGGDIVSGLYACGLCGRSSGTWLFLDLGTNAEMVMGNGDRIVCTAAAAGPAFEGRGGKGEAGTERIAAIARLLEKGLLDKTGLLEEPYFETGIEVETSIEMGAGTEVREEIKMETEIETKEEVAMWIGTSAEIEMEPEMEIEGKMEAGMERAADGTETEAIGNKVWISQKDIRDIQMAKAAVRAGIHFLMEHMEISDYEEIEKVYVAGGFGFYLDKRAAARIGLIPSELEKKIETAGNTSLAGARFLGEKILEKDSRREKTADLEIMDRLEEFAQRAEVFHLAQEPGFEKVYVDYLNFPEWK